MNYKSFIHRPELDEFENKTKNEASEGKCDGSCEQHIGECKAFRVVAPDGYDWGWFSYCSIAQEEDRNRGFQLFEQTPQQRFIHETNNYN